MYVKDLVLAAIIIAFPFSVSAKEISYSYVQASYISMTVDTETTAGNVDGNGYAFSGSASVAPNFAITAGFGSSSLETFQGVDVDATQLFFGITAYTSISQQADVFVNFSVVKADSEVTKRTTTRTNDDTGNIFGGGIRFLASDHVELNVTFSRMDIFDDSSTGFGLGARFYANNIFSVGIDYGNTDDTDTLGFSARMDF